MKSSKFIKLLAALLCVVVMFVSCSGTATVAPESNGIDSLSGVAGNVPSLSDTTGDAVVEEETKQLTFSDFIELIDRDKVYKDVEDAPEGVIDIYENYYLIFESSVDAKNQLTYSYEVINVENGESVKKWEYTADQARPEKEILVEFKSDDYGTAIIMVYEAEIGYITEEMREDNYLIRDEQRYYYKGVSISAYDFFGNVAFENKKVNSGSMYPILFENETSSGTYNGCILYVFDESYYMFDKDGKFVECVAATDIGYGNFDYENDKYGYYLSADTDLEKNAIQVFDKTNGKLVYFKTYNEIDCIEDGYAWGSIVNVFAEGKILVQRIRRAYNGENYDFAISENGEIVAYMLDSYIIEFSEIDGKFVATEKSVELEYIYQMIISAKEYQEIMGDEVKLTENFKNIAVALKIENRTVSTASMMGATVLVDDDLNVQYTPSVIVPIANIYKMETLGNGYSYVEVSIRGNDYIALYDAEGNFVRYMTSDNKLLDSFFYNEYGVFDYEFNLIRSFDDDETVVCEFGDSLIISKYIEETDYNDEETIFYRWTLVERTEMPEVDEDDENESAEGAEGEGEGETELEPIVIKEIKETRLEYIERVDFYSDDFIILYNGEDETFNLYNIEFELLFVSMNGISVDYNSYLHAYVMETYIKGEYRCYIIK